jgi:hypothetical protein
MEHLSMDIEHNDAIFDYEKILYDSILVNDASDHSFKHKHLWVKKATGLGVTEFFFIFSSKKQPASHNLTSFARLTDDKIITYPEKI